MYILVELLSREFYGIRILEVSLVGENGYLLVEVEIGFEWGYLLLGYGVRREILEFKWESDEGDKVKKDFKDRDILEIKEKENFTKKMVFIVKGYRD